MKTVLSIFLILLMCSCQEEVKRQNTEPHIKTDTSINKGEIGQNLIREINIKPDTTKEHENKKDSPDSLPLVIVDDYPVTNAMFRSAKYPEEPVLDFDGVWYSNENQTLAIALYTDYHRYKIYHFRNHEVPTDLIKRMELHKPFPDSDTADIKLKSELFPEVFKESNEIDKSYFISKKGFQLGDSMIKAIKEYGEPDKVSKIDGNEILYWVFIGDILYDAKQDLKGKQLAKNSFGHAVTMYFKNEVLIAIVLHNEIP